MRSWQMESGSAYCDLQLATRKHEENEEEEEKKEEVGFQRQWGRIMQIDWIGMMLLSLVYWVSEQNAKLMSELEWLRQQKSSPESGDGSTQSWVKGWRW
eukprot:s185_g3.t1